jgi:chromosome segregation protein
LYLKSIEIIGFKSFADKTKLLFPPGITAVVGPNGCGKSNIADALRWVLGEQSAKSLRGSKMPDVIFAGTTTRKPLNYAEVTITLGDIQGSLPVEYEELSLTRRLHRSGESEYFINRHPVRLRDIQSLFWDSGMGKDAYSIFEQGKIDQVIQLSPLERRYIFEEAAGILRFLLRKKEALKKLEQSESNITRVKDIHREVEKQIVVLEQQAEKAKIYKQNKAQLESLEKGIFLLRWEQAQNHGRESKKKENVLKEQVGQFQTVLDMLQVQLLEAKTDYLEAEKLLKAKNEDVYKTRSDKEIKIREKQAALEGLKEAVAREKRWQHELDVMQEKRKQRQGEKLHAQKMQKNCEGELSLCESQLQALRSQAQMVELEVAKLRDQQQGIQRDLLKITQEESRQEGEFKQKAVHLENSRERKAQVLARQQKLVEHQLEIERQSEEKQKIVKELSQVLEEQKKTFLKLEHDQHDLIDVMTQSQNHLDAIHREIAEVRAKVKMLLKLREEMEGFSPGTKRLLQEATKQESPLYQKLKGLYEYILPREGFELATSVIMRAYAQTLVVLTKKDFDVVLEFSDTHHIHDFSLVCLEHILHRNLQVSESLSLLEKFDFNEISKHFFGKIHLVSEASSAIKMSQEQAGKEIWVEEGAWIDHNQVGFFSPKNEKNIFEREAELKVLEKRLGECEQAKLDQEILFKGLQQRKMQLQSERIELDKFIRKGEMKLVEASFALQRQQNDQEKAQAEMVQGQEELKKLDAFIEKLSTESTSIKQKYLEAAAKKEEIGQKLNELNKELEKKISAFKLEQSTLQTKESGYHKLAGEHRKAQHELHVLEVKDYESVQQEKRLEEEIKNIRALQIKFKGQSDEYESILQAVEKDLEEVIAATKNLETESGKRRQVIDKIERLIQEERGRLKKIETELYQVGNQTTQAENQAKSLASDLQERYRITIEEAQTFDFTQGRPLDQVEKEFRALRVELENAGDINMTSIEEFDKHKTRYEFLNQQIDDLNISKQELVQIITQLDSESRKIFQDTFEKIRENFKKNFGILFNGGEADLQFTESSDVLEAGIEIVAKPPGKQMRSINLLSGGEKCLTAMALLFAIFEVKPAPYCILDEIDAPLDDSNIERFVNVVKQFLDRSQFIIITHNKRTMAIADQLFGVSMEEKGVSKLLSMEFSEEPVVAEV